MTESPLVGANLGAVSVTYHPELAQLTTQFEALPTETVCVIVDNGSPADIVADLEKFCSGTRRILLVCNSENRGLGAAINQGVKALHSNWPTLEYLLLLDQDSEPEPGSIEQLISNLQRLEYSNTVGAVGPVLVEPRFGLNHGFHQLRGWRWYRRYPAVDETAPIACDNLNGSGTLMRLSRFLDLGGLDESLFIDHVDTEWAFRLHSRGFGTWGIPSARFTHRMGMTSVRFWMFGWRLWPSRSPARHRYLFRNAIHLMRRSYVPFVWKFWCSLKLLMTAIVHAGFGRNGRKQLKSMWFGVLDGLRGNTGAIADE